MALYLLVIGLTTHLVWTMIQKRNAGYRHSNPYYRGGWYEYVTRAEPKRPGEDLILIIANSQGVCVDPPDAPLYAQLTEEILSTPDSPVRVVNWSVAGGQISDFLVLAAAARRLQPSMLIMVMPTRFVYEKSGGSSAKSLWGSDTFYLLADRSTRRSIPKTTLSRITDLSLRADITAGWLWSGWRIRHRPALWLGELSLLRPFRASARRPTRAQLPDPSSDPAAHLPLKQWLDLELANLYLDLAVKTAPEVIWINMPLHSDWRGGARQVEWRECESICSAHGVRARDWSDRIPDEAFITISHFTAEGHRLFAEHLAREVRP